jgi:hypothetical protein
MSCRTQLSRERFINREVQRALRLGEHRQLVPELRKNRAAVGQVAQVILECCESGDDLALHSESRRPVRDALLGLGEEAGDGIAQLTQRGSLGLIELGQIPIDLLL